MHRNQFTTVVLTSSQRLVSLWLIILTFNFLAYAGGPGTTGAAFLKIGVGAKNIAMGETGSVSEDANSIYWNPAGLAGASKKEVSLMYGLWLETINYNHLSVALPLSFGTIGIGGNVLTMGAMDKYDNTGTKVAGQTFTASDMATTVSYAKALKGGINFGLNIKYISSTIDSQNASAIGVDAGAQIKINDRIKTGIAVQNIGSGINYKMTANSTADPLPMNIKLGCSYNIIAAAGGPNRLIAALDINSPSDNDVRFNFGAEYAHGFGTDITLYGRAGYRSNTKGLTGLAGPTAGIGFGIKNYSLDWAFVPYGQLGDTHRISFSAKF